MFNVYIVLNKKNVQFNAASVLQRDRGTERLLVSSDPTGYLVGYTHRPASYSRQNEKKTDREHKEDQNNGEQPLAEDEGSPL